MNYIVWIDGGRTEQNFMWENGSNFSSAMHIITAEQQKTISCIKIFKALRDLFQTL